jgi:hypothetical protein
LACPADVHSLTDLAEREHLLTPEVGLDTHIQDVLAGAIRTQAGRHTRRGAELRARRYDHRAA